VKEREREREREKERERERERERRCNPMHHGAAGRKGAMKSQRNEISSCDAVEATCLLILIEKQYS